MKQSKKQKLNRKTIRKNLWEIVKTIIRRRDANICQRCGKYVVGRDSHTSHVISKARSLRLYYDIVNLKVLCMFCHNWWHKNPTESGRWFKEKFPARDKYLQKRNIEIQGMGSVKTYELKEWLEELEESLE